MRFVGSQLHFQAIPATDLVLQFGSPLYVYEGEIIRRQIQQLRDAFGVLPFRPFYAMKANSNLSILRLLREEGFGCDAVSPGEVFLAQRAGFAPSDIWFTCSNVSDQDLLELQNETIVINVNSMAEVDRCLALGLKNPIAFRINPEVGAGHHKDVVTGGFGVKFGLDRAEVAEARKVARDGGLEIIGLHAHVGSGVMEAAPLLESASRLIETAAEFEDLRFLNFGGGIGVPYRPGEPDFPLAEYAAGLQTIAGAFLRDREITAILEPGRYMIAEAGTLLTTVTSKRVSAGFEWIGCDSGFNHLVRPSKYGSYHHIVNATGGSDADLRPSASSPVESADGVIVAGNLCESGDVFTRDQDRIIPRPLGMVRQGDLLAICDAGAYGYSMASEYNARMLPAEVLVDEGKVLLIRRRETYEDLLRGQE